MTIPSMLNWGIRRSKRYVFAHERLRGIPMPVAYWFETDVDDEALGHVE